MAFVTCKQLKDFHAEQSKGNISAEESLLDKSSGQGGGKVTITKIKESIAGDVEIAVKNGSGISGNGTKDSPLTLNLGDSLRVGEDGKINVSTKGIATIRLVDAGGSVHLGSLVGV